MKYIYLILSVLACFMLTSCSSGTLTNEKQEVEAVYMHEYDDYSVMIKAHDNRLIHKPLIMVYTSDVEIVTDVKENEKCWYEGVLREGNWDCNGYTELKIHIRSVDDINTAGWNHGKFGSGTTQRID